MANLLSTLTLDNSIFAQFVFYATIVLVKMMIMSLMTNRFRLTYAVSAYQTDSKPGELKSLKTLKETCIERISRCHINDIENIVAFVFIGCFYCITGPNPFYASLHFRLFVAFRLFHTIAFLIFLPPPSRALAFAGGWIVTASMAVVVLKAASL